MLAKGKHIEWPSVQPMLTKLTAYCKKLSVQVSILTLVASQLLEKQWQNALYLYYVFLVSLLIKMVFPFCSGSKCLQLLNSILSG